MASVSSKAIAPYVRLVLYYVGVALAVALIRWLWPGVYAMFAQGTGNGVAVGPALFGNATHEPTGPLTEPYPVLATALVTIGAFLVMLPVAWVYMITKQREGYDRSVVQTLIVLPTAICGVVVMVQNSFALAFALTGIVAAVRFRNTLKDTKDAVYIFLAIGVGLASGVQYVDVAMITSVLFNLTILGLWFTNFGNVYAAQAGDPELLASLGPGGVDQMAGASPLLVEKLRETEGLPKNKRPDATLTVLTSNVEAAQPMVEAILASDTKVWDLLEITAEDEDTGTLEYLVRAKKSIPPAMLVDKLEGQCAPYLTGVEYRMLGGGK